MRETDTASTTTETTANAAAAAGLSPADIAEAMANPQSFSVDGLSQTNRSFSDQREGWRLLNVMKRSRCRCHPLAGMVSHLIPPGTCDR